jgi:Rab-like protein 5
VSEQTDVLGSASKKYAPTVGVRVLEFERDIPGGRGGGGWGGNNKLPIELWDVSGDHKYEPCWKAITKDVAGVVIMYNPTKKNDERDIPGGRTIYLSQVTVTV